MRSKSTRLPKLQRKEPLSGYPVYITTSVQSGLAHSPLLSSPIWYPITTNFPSGSLWMSPAMTYLIACAG